MRTLALSAACLVLWASVAAAEPVASLRIGAQRFENGASVFVPGSLTEPLNIWLEDTLKPVTVSSVRVQLNGTPMGPFVTVNRLPRGVRVILKLGLSLGADFSLRAGTENVVLFSAADESGATYTATFYLTP